MTGESYRFLFKRSAVLEEAELTLHLATFAVEGLVGQARVRLDARYHIDAPQRIITVYAENEVGCTLVRVFTGLLLREFGAQAFRVQRLRKPGPTGARGRAA